MKNSPLTEASLIEAINKQKAQRKAAKGFVVAESAEGLPGSVRITDSVEPTKEEVKEEVSKESVKEEVKAESKPSVSLEEIQSVLAAAIAPLQQQIQSVTAESKEAQEKASKLAAELEKANSELQAAKQKVDEHEKSTSILDGLSKLIGSPVSPGSKKVEMPNVNTLTSTNDEPKGIAKDFINLLNDRDTLRINHNVRGFSQATGQIYATQRDHAPIARFIQSHFAEEKAKGNNWRNSALVKDVEAWFKANGLLSGGRNVNAAGPTSGASGSAPNLFLDVLSSMMRETHNQTNVFWQFPITVFDPTSEPGKNILIPRWNYLPAPTTLSDFVIANTTTFNPIDLTIGSGSDSQGLEATTVPVSVTQYGLGRGIATGSRPVFIPEFHQATSLLSLVDAVDSRLMQHYYLFEELLIRSQFEQAATVLYNDNGNVTTTASNVGLGDGGTMTRTFLSSVYTQMFSDKIPSLPNGRYILVVNPTALNQIKNDLDSQYRPVTESEMQAVTNTLRMASGVEIGQVSGYVGAYEGFEIFVSNSFGVGAAGASATVQNTSFAVGSTLTNDSFAFGVGAVGRGVALPMEIRSQGSPFDLGSAFIWVSREGAKDIDLDSTVTTDSQTRCYKLRTSRVAV